MAKAPTPGRPPGCCLPAAWLLLRLQAWTQGKGKKDTKEADLKASQALQVRRLHSTPAPCMHAVDGWAHVHALSCAQARCAPANQVQPLFHLHAGLMLAGGGGVWGWGMSQPAA
jgi:hypothetical protein